MMTKSRHDTDYPAAKHCAANGNMSEKCEHGIRDLATNLPHCRHCDQKTQAPFASAGSATPKRMEHLITVMRYRLNRAMNYFNTGKISKGKQDVDETIKILAILESEILTNDQAETPPNRDARKPETL
jgi:hypothetical protein